MEAARQALIKDFLLVRSPAEISLEITQGYLELNHAPLALSVPLISQKMQLYTMNHVAAVAGECCLYQPIQRMATVVEHGLGGWHSLEQIMADPQYVARIRPDEEYMVTHIMDGWPQFVAVTDVHPVFSSDARTELRMFDFVRRPVGLAREEFLSGLAADASWAATNRHYRSGIAKRVHSVAMAASAPIGLEGEAFDAVIEVWIADAAELASLMDEQRQRRSAFCDAIRSCTVMTRERRIRG